MNNMYYPNNMYGQNTNYGNNVYEQSMNNQYGYNSYVQPTINRQDIRIDIRYGTLEDIQKYPLLPMGSITFVNSDVGEFYVKTADNIGKPTIETYSYIKKEFANTTDNNSKIEYVTKEELNDYVTVDTVNSLIKEIEELNKKLENREI